MITSRRKERTKACEFGKQERWLIYSRDRGKCIFCQSGRADIKMPKSLFEEQIDGYMHYIPRSQGGLGISQNGALGCHYHHTMLDNGSDREQAKKLKEYFREYLKSHYDGWNEEDLVYDKWRFLEKDKK